MMKTVPGFHASGALRASKFAPGECVEPPACCACTDVLCALDHGIAALLARKDFGIGGDVRSDCGHVIDRARAATTLDDPEEDPLPRSR